MSQCQTVSMLVSPAYNWGLSIHAIVSLTEYSLVIAIGWSLMKKQSKFMINGLNKWIYSVKNWSQREIHKATFKCGKSSLMFPAEWTKKETKEQIRTIPLGKAGVWKSCWRVSNYWGMFEHSCWRVLTPGGRRHTEESTSPLPASYSQRNLV